MLFKFKFSTCHHFNIDKTLRYNIEWVMLVLARIASLLINISLKIYEKYRKRAKSRKANMGEVCVCVCVCVCLVFNDDKVMGNHITLKSTGCSCPWVQFTLGDKPVSQPALFQTLVGHSVIVVRHACPVILSGIYKAAPTGFPPAAAAGRRFAQPTTPETVYSPTPAGRLLRSREI